jgi:putative SOS response-associated peptidase YedK
LRQKEDRSPNSKESVHGLPDGCTICLSRCESLKPLIPADGFYEWRKTARPKLPFAIAMKDGRPFTFAGLWENWKDPESGEWLRTCTIITGEPNELVAQIHPRMPVILPPATSRRLVR